MTREQAREYVNSRLSVELAKAPKKVSGYDTFICPFCGNGRGKDGDGITTKDGKHYKCFKCGEYGDYLQFLKKLKGTNNETDIFAVYNLNIDKKEDKEQALPLVSPISEEDYKIFFLEANKNLRESSEALEYLKSRGISLKTANLFLLGYISDWRSPAALRNGRNPPVSSRLIIPTSSNSYLARAISNDTDPAYKLMKEGVADFFNKKALYEALPVFITEGALDALSIIEAGGEACALGSTSGVNKFLELCKTEPPTATLILSLDNDEAGKKAQEKLKAGLEALKLSFFEVNTSGQYKDPNEHLTADREAFTALVNSNPAELAKEESEAEKMKYLETATSHHINALMGEIDASADTPAVSTGFKQLDEALDGGLYEGLYFIGAISSLGKTTFILQVADQIAQQGQDVLIFSLEMSRFELMAKSISRLTLKNCGSNTLNAKTTRGILSGAKRRYYSEEEKNLINQSVKEYELYSKCIFIHEGMGNIGVDEIRREVQRHISFTGNTPVVIIDYLQIIAPCDMSATDKQNIDKVVLELKRLSRNKKIPVIAVSSFNRENYTAPVNLASFKESGAIEYSSDVLLGLQLSGMDELSQSDSKRVEATKLIEAKKSADPRSIQLKILKNRNGKTGMSLYYDYYPLFNTFKEATEAQSKRGLNSDVRHKI